MSNETKQPAQKTPKLILGVVMLIFGGMLLTGGIRGLFDDKRQVVAPRGSVNVEFVDTPELLQLGLSGRHNLDRNSGMLFSFDTSSDKHCFWMKDMKFAIDIVWLDSDKKVVHVESDVKPESYPDSFCPDEPAQYVLEVNSGRADQLGISDGVELKF